MALNFKGETTTAVLNNTENVYKKDDLFRLYDAGVLKLGNVVCEHGDFVSWTGTSWQLEKDAGYAVETGGAGESLEERVGAIEEVIPAGTSKSNPLMNAAETERMILKFSPIEANTLRFEFSKTDYDPIVAGVATTGVWKKVSTHKENNIWDWIYNQTTIGGLFVNAFSDVENLVSIIAAGTLSWTTFYQTFVNCSSLIYVCDLNTPDVTSLNGAFDGCTGLRTIPNINTSKVTIFYSCFRNCTGVKKIPLIDTQKASNVSLMFDGCVNVEEGALALYTQMSTQATPPSTTANCFKNCGKDTITGAAELAQIPASWGGTGA